MRSICGKDFPDEGSFAKTNLRWPPTEDFGSEDRASDPQEGYFLRKLQQPFTQEHQGM